MYDPPKLNRVGDATKVILGLIDQGADLDTTLMIKGFEFAEEYSFDADATQKP
jgi:hypothetical protein